MSKIPSEEEFARAKQLMREQSRNLSKVCEAVRMRFESVCPLFSVHMLPQRDVACSTTSSSTRTRTMGLAHSGVTRQIEDFVYEQLELAGRGSRADITVAFEYNSNENFLAKYDGDYMLRLR